MAESKPSYKKLKAELDAVIEALQAEDLDVEEALVQYERGQKLIKSLEKYLKTAENKLRELKVDFKPPSI